MLLPLPMLKAEVVVHQDHIDSVLYSLGTHNIVEIDDIRPRLEADKGLKARVRPIEPSPLLFQLSSLSSRINALITILNMPESMRAAQVPEEALDDATLKQISGFLNQLQEEVSKLQSRIGELEQAEAITPEAENELQAAREELKRIVDEDGSRLLAYQALVEPRLRLENVKTRMGRTDATFVFQGWLQKENAEAFRELVEKTSQGNCFVSLEPPRAYHVRHGHRAEHGHEQEIPETPPTLLSNPRIAGVYQKLVVAFGVPNYFELDPAVFWLFTFPIIFGLMFGDLGQGAVLAALASVGYLYKRRGVKGGELTTYMLEGAPLFIMSGIAAAIIGWFYGEVFGFHIGHPGAHEEAVVYIPGLVEAREALLESLKASLGPLGLRFELDFSPLRYPTVLLKLAIYVAIVHMSLGLVLQLVDEVRNRHYMRAFSGPFTWLWLYLGGAYLFVIYGGGVFAVLFSNVQLILTFVLLPFIVMLVSRMREGGVEGLGEALDSLISTLSNTISYARIFAFAMIHAVLNSIFLQLGSGLGVPAVGALFGTLFFVFFEVVFVFFQALRLHWVEFGLKFYSGDGVPFKPFSMAGPS